MRMGRTTRGEDEERTWWRRETWMGEDGSEGRETSPWVTRQRGGEEGWERERAAAAAAPREEGVGEVVGERSVSIVVMLPCRLHTSSVSVEEEEDDIVVRRRPRRVSKCPLSKCPRCLKEGGVGRVEWGVLMMMMDDDW